VSLTLAAFNVASGAVIDLTGGGGFASVTTLLAAVLSDGAGGSMLPLGDGGQVHFIAVAPSVLRAGNFSLA